MYQISVVNRTSCIADREIHRVVRAINRQISEDFEPYWAFGGRLRVEGPAGPDSELAQLKELRGDAILYILDSAAHNDVLGYHDQNLAGIPFGFVYLDLCKSVGDEWSTTLSHEALELIGDPQCNLLVQGPDPADTNRTVYHFFEMCDAVQAQSYVIDGVTVSDFVLPHYFTPEEEAGLRNDFCATDLKSFGVSSGGYIGFFDPEKGDYRQYFAHDELAQRRLNAKAGGLGRVVRRSSMQNEPASRKSQLAGRFAATAANGATVSTLPGDPIRHVVVLMMENRSFDHMLGALQVSNPDIDGVDPQNPGVNLDAKKDNAPHKQTPMAAQFVSNDFKVPHEFENVTRQIADGMAHFVDEFRSLNQNAQTGEIDQVMAYFKDGDLPALHTLAKSFTVCDRWFSSMPGPTWPNRFFVHTGTSLGDVLMPDGVIDTVRMFFGRYSQRTIYDELSDKGISWKIYHGGVPQSIVLSHLKRRYFTSSFQEMDAFFDDCKGPESAFPAYSFIEPRYFDGVLGGENDQHSPAGVVAGEQLIADVYNAIRANQALWESTLLVITYDEHGGFYDHVVPPATVAPDENTDNYAFNQLGVRVPAVLVSPWVAKGVDHTLYDHTSVLRYVCEKWGLPAICRRTVLAAGEYQSGTFVSAISQAKLRTDTPERISAPAPSSLMARKQMEAPSTFHDAQTALVSYAELVRQERERTMGRLAPTRPALAIKGNGKKAPVPVSERAKAIETWFAQEKGSARPAIIAAPISVPPDISMSMPGKKVTSGGQHKRSLKAKGRTGTSRSGRS
ncbi:alkaline phosphatase family protein [Paraburkholderia strydomiana]|uniref:alkaline phosphatase family protein n=1 Tax=Paraburkholderia strydomiana TaxID=1245417 RepID=UPI0028654944|nr:alkaline phosphatase family protein [Paraburkholderia strydomiana]MDR7008818.1 phospholipase C [Paraburkholderia strydomiana]